VWITVMVIPNRDRMAALPSEGHHHRSEMTQNPTPSSSRASSNSSSYHRVVPAVRRMPSIGGGHAQVAVHVGQWEGPVMGSIGYRTAPGPEYAVRDSGICEMSL
jgi:hypothetical protein